MTWKYYLRRVLSVPPHIAVQKTLKLGGQVAQKAWMRRRDMHRGTYADPSIVPEGGLHYYFKPLAIELLRPHATKLAALGNLYLNHTFDLLGSGWVQVRHGMSCRGLENYRYAMGQAAKAGAEGHWLIAHINAANLNQSRRIWQMIDLDYTPIDWHLDFKSGYRWDETTWYQDIVYGHAPGVDIKVPWELARMQHLPQLAWAYALASDSQESLSSPRVYVREFRNEVLDFIASNPPRFGVNWRCPMDVGIRAANWLVAYDLFRAYDAEFDPPFEAELKRSLYQHGQHIASNLEWYPEGRGNHYLADIVGLLFVAAYLPCTPEVDAWLAFAVQELVGEVRYQFNSDGSNFEASTSYHRLSTEMVTYATALIMALPPEKQAALQRYDHRLLQSRPMLEPAPAAEYPLPVWYFERLERAAEFTLRITKPNYHIPQVGDNDSGRFIKLQPVLCPITVNEARERYANLEEYDDLPINETYWDEDTLDHRHLVAAANGLFGRSDFADFVGANQLETEIVQSIAGSTVSSHHPSGVRARLAEIGTKEDWEHPRQQQSSTANAQRYIVEIPLPGRGLWNGLALCSYPDFGLYIYHSKRVYLAIRCGSIGQYGTGGHAHNDQLSIELNVDGEDWIADPGTYLYTSLPQRRNEYRSTRAHFGPRLANKEPWSLDTGLFQLSGKASTACLCFRTEGFVGILTMPEGSITRSIQLAPNKVVVIDTTSNPKILIAREQPSLDNKRQPSFSNGYGKRLRE